MNFKQLLLFVFSFVIFSNLLAQDPVLTSNEMLPYGSMMHFKYGSNFEVIDTTLQGENVEWDFSTLEVDDDFFIEIVAPADTPFGDEFPDANYVYAESPQIAYRFFALDEMKMERVGSWFNNSLNTYSDPQIEYVFPLEVGVSNFDTWDNTNSSFGGTYNLQCIGSGTLILPNGTYEDALMVRVTLEELFEYDAYFWYSSENGAILLEYFIGDGFFTGTFALVLNELTSTVKTEEKAFIEKISYNNPVIDQLNLELFTNDVNGLQYKLIDLNGKCIATANVSNSIQNYYQIQLDMGYYSNGMYFLQLISDQQMQTIPLVKSN